MGTKLGSWRAVEGQYAPYFSILTDSGKPIGDEHGVAAHIVALVPLPKECAWGTPADECTLDRATSVSHAHLIAAAPDMLAALQAVMQCLRDGAPVRCGGLVAAAIRRATPSDASQAEP